MHVYHIRSGEWFTPEGTLLAICHSGHGVAMNDPARCSERNVGPIPPGFYDLGPAYHHPKTGPISMRLTPHPGTNTFGRSGFLVHGPNSTPDPADDSEGCPIMTRGPRALLALSTDRVVEVVADRPQSVPIEPVVVETELTGPEGPKES
jgi:hypothetical protein